MADSILSQAEIDALLRRSASAESHKQLTSAFAAALDSVARHFQVLVPHAVSIEGPYVEQVQQKLDILFIEDVFMLPISLGQGEFFAFIAVSEAEYLAEGFGGEVDWALQTVFEGWIKYLSEGFSEISGKYKPYRLGDAVRIPHEELGQLPVEDGSLMVRHAVCWSENCVEVSFFIRGSRISSLLQETEPSAVKTVGVRTASPAAARSSSLAMPQLPVRTAVFTELTVPDQSSVDLPLDLVEDVWLDVIVELGHTTMTLHELMELEPNTTFALHRPAGDPVDVYVSGQCIAKAEVTVVDDRFGIRILDIVPEDERIRDVTGS